MRKALYITLVAVSFFSRHSVGQVDYWDKLVYFSGNSTNHIPKGIDIPNRDTQSRSIINAIISGRSERELQKEFPDSLTSKLARLIAGDVILKEDDRYETTFPLIVGSGRDNLTRTIHKEVKRLIPSIVKTLVIPLRSCLSRDSDMLFHFLWSRVIDDCWWDLYNKEFNTNQGPPDIAFIVYPLHPFQCGTNFDDTPGDGQIAISWSYDLFTDFFSIPKTKSFYNAAMTQRIPEQDRNFFISHGLLDSRGTSKIFTYHTDDKIDSTCHLLKNTYISLIGGRFDYRKLSKKYHVAPDDFFIVMMHEIAYEIFEFLQEKGMFIPIKRASNPTIDFRYLVSIRL